MRGTGAVESIQSTLPEWSLSLLGIVTTLGDLPVLVGAACLALVGLDRKRGAYVFAVILGGLALLGGLKATLAFPRPDQSLHLIETASTGFPSGHALGTTVVYGTLALEVDRGGSQRRRLAVACTVVALVSLSRVALGVHYPVDVVAGVLVGVVYLVVARWLTGREPSSAFRLAAALATCGFVLGTVTGPTPYADTVAGIALDRDATTILGATVGALAAWRAVERRPPGSTLVAVVLIAAGTVGYVADPHVAVRAVAAAAGTAGVVLAADRWHRSTRSL